MKSTAATSENKLVSHLQKLGIRHDIYRTEFQQQADRDADDYTRTPDILFTVPVPLLGEENIYWIECKSGISIPGLSPEKQLKQLEDQIESYTSEFGKGIIFWDHPLGFCQRTKDFLPQAIHVTPRDRAQPVQSKRAKKPKKMHPPSKQSKLTRQEQPGARKGESLQARFGEWYSLSAASSHLEGMDLASQVPCPPPHSVHTLSGVHTLADMNRREFDTKHSGEEMMMTHIRDRVMRRLLGHEHSTNFTHSKGNTIGSTSARMQAEGDLEASSPTGFCLNDIRSTLEESDAEKDEGCGKSESDDLRRGRVKCNGKMFEMSCQQNIGHLYENVFRECGDDLKDKRILLFLHQHGERCAKIFDDLRMSIRSAGVLNSKVGLRIIS
jgi:hypothetical protein